MIAMAGLFGAAAASAAAPGPCLLVAANRAATDGLGSGLRVTLGIAGSKIILLIASWGLILGTLTLSRATEEFLRTGGLALLVILALGMLAARPAPVAGATLIGGLRLSDGALGLALGLTSPLNLLVMFALLPQFVDLARLDAAAVLQASAAVLLGGALPVLIACRLAARVRMTGPDTARRVNRACGALLLGFAGLALMAAP